MTAAEFARLLAESDGAEWVDWYALAPLQRWEESSKLWQTYLALGGSLDPNPILKVLSSMATRQVRSLMGSRACVLYGAAKFSRDSSTCGHW